MGIAVWIIFCEISSLFFFLLYYGDKVTNELGLGHFSKYERDISPCFLTVYAVCVSSASKNITLMIYFRAPILHLNLEEFFVCTIIF